MNELGVLARYARPRRRGSGEELRCELCAEPLRDAHGHDHLVDVQRRTLRCACRACALLFSEPGAAGGRYRLAPRRVLADIGLDLDDTWDALDIPVRLAFLFRNSAAERWVAVYPGPAGATESELPLQAWSAVVARTPVLQDMAPDVEALLVHGDRGASLQSFLVPIDTCYALVALVRRHWRGFDGGIEFRSAFDGFLAGLRSRSAASAGATP